MHCRPLIVCAATCAVILFATDPALAVFSKPLPLKEVVEDTDFIFLTKVEQVRATPAPPGLILTLTENLKGKGAFERLPINLTGDSDAKKHNHTEAMLERVEKDMPVLIFVTKVDKEYYGSGFTNGTWFSMNGRVEKDNGKEVVRWSFLHCEPYLRKTFKGTTGELKEAIAGALSKKKELPPLNDNEPPGLGPPLKKKTELPRGVGGLYAVIQLPFLGAIAALAALFPAVFGGLALTMRRWMIALSIASLLSLLYFLVFVAEWIDWSWLRTPQSFWMTCAVIAALGSLWAARRYRRAVLGGNAGDMQARRLDRTILTLVAVGVLVWLVIEWRGGARLTESPWTELIVCWVPVAAAAWFTLMSYRRARKQSAPARPDAISAETVALWGLTYVCGFVGALEAGRAGRPIHADGPALVQNEAVNGVESALAPKVNLEPLWIFSPDEPGAILGTPCLTPKGVVVAVGHKKSFAEYGRVHCLDMKTGAIIWTFGGGDDRMAYAFCSPVYADGRIFIGEGLHKDNECRMFCLNAETGEKLWAFKTGSHTESTPCVAGDRVVFGAGNDGIYCVDVKTGDEVWHHTGERGLHIDANPFVYEGRVYAGSGLSRTHQVNRIFCLDLQTGRELWGERVEHSAYGSPMVHEGVAYFGIGNGNYSEDRPPVYGALLARDARTGEKKWDHPLPNSIVGRPAASGNLVCVGTRDGLLYALDRRTGKEVWKQGMGGPVLASPVADFCPGCGRTEAIYAAGEYGRVVALSPDSGNVYWILEIGTLAQKPAVELAGAPVLVREANGNKVRRKVLVGVGVGDTQNRTKPRLYCFEDETVH